MELRHWWCKKFTIYPGIADDYAAFRKLEFSNFCLDSFVVQYYLLDPHDLLAICTSMDVGPETHIGLNIALR